MASTVPPPLTNLKEEDWGDSDPELKLYPGLTAADAHSLGRMEDGSFSAAEIKCQGKDADHG
jgi:hypothetical protein